LTKICVKNDFYIFIPSDLDLCPLDFTFATLVTRVQRYVYITLEGYGFSVSRKLEPQDRWAATLNAGRVKL